VLHVNRHTSSSWDSTMTVTIDSVSAIEFRHIVRVAADVDACVNANADGSLSSPTTA
jgi:hypothetical protein